MLSHADVWRGVDRLAEVNDLSPSGLARRSGLDPTTFNKSKRATRDGRPRWPSTESLSKILDATQTTMAEFVALLDPGVSALPSPTVPCARLTSMNAEQFDPAGFPIGPLDRIEVNHLAGQHLYAVEIDDDAYRPLYRAGDTLLVAPDAGIRRGDRVLMMPRTGSPSLGVLIRRTADKVTLSSVLDATPVETRLAGVSWLARIVWASQ